MGWSDERKSGTREADERRVEQDVPIDEHISVKFKDGLARMNLTIAAGQTSRHNDLGEPLTRSIEKRSIPPSQHKVQIRCRVCLDN